MDTTVGHPSDKGRSSGRDVTTGRFVKGYKGGKGNPYARKNADFKKLLQAAISDADLYDLARVLVDRGKSGDVSAIRELFDRLFGKAKATLAVEEETRTPGELRARLKGMLTSNPGLIAMVHELVDSTVVAEVEVTQTATPVLGESVDVGSLLNAGSLGGGAGELEGGTPPNGSCDVM